MAINRDSTPYPPSGGLVGIDGGNDLISIRTVADGVVPISETSLGDINVNGCQTLTIWMQINFGSGPLTEYNIVVYHQITGDNSIYTFHPISVWDISDAAFDSLATAQKGLFFNFTVSGNEAICVPTYGANSIRLQHLGIGVNTGSSVVINVTRGWSMHHTLSNSTIVTQA